MTIEHNQTSSPETFSDASGQSLGPDTSNCESLRKPIVSVSAKLAVGVWALMMTVVVASLMVSHWVVLPHPSAGSSTNLTAIRNAPTTDEWFAFHFLYGDCPCSRRVLKQVVSRNALEGVIERVVLIGNDPEMESVAELQGYEVEVVTPRKLKERFGVESAPLLVVVDGEGTIRYSGGYTSRKQGLDIQDVSLIRRTVAGEQFEELPLYGCAVSKSLKSIVDPFGLKY